MANANEIKRKGRICQPAHFTLEIKSYSLLSKAAGDKYESGWFSAGKYQWKLILYPKKIKGDRHGNDHISLSLAIKKTTCIDNREIPVNFKLFMFNWKMKQYDTIQDDTHYFSEQKTQREFPKFLSLKEFESKEYLENDCCTFGAEIFVIEPNAQNEILTMVNKPEIRSMGKSTTYTWEIKEFSKLKVEAERSEEFTVKGIKWKIFIRSKEKDRYLGMGLADRQSVGKVYAEFKLRVKNRKDNNEFVKYGQWFNQEEQIRKDKDIIPLKNIHDHPKEYLKNDTLTVEVKFEVISEIIAKPRK